MTRCGGSVPSAVETPRRSFLPNNSHRNFQGVRFMVRGGVSAADPLMFSPYLGSGGETGKQGGRK